MIHVGEAMFYGTPGRWSGGGEIEASHRHLADPMWIVDALAEGAAVGEARPPRDTDPPGSRRAAFRLDLDEETGRRMGPGAQRVRTVGFRGEACVDRDGRLVAVQVTPIELRRSRPRSLTVRESDVSSWTALELSEFGIPVSIEVPEVTPTESRPFPLEVLSVARDLRRAKRRHAQRADAARGAA